MIAIEDKELEKCHSEFLEICFGETPLGDVDKTVSQKITGFGTNINEKIESFSDFVSLLKVQREESVGVDMDFSFIPVSKNIFVNGIMAVFIDSINLKMVIEDSALELNVRLSSIFAFENEKWSAVHFHGSFPQGVEGNRDAWSVNEWKDKNDALERIIIERTRELEQSLVNLKAAQEQLIVQEKLASLGQLAAGIAHEIKNPMNFVNNFSELSLEYVEEIRSELAKLDNNDIVDDITELLNDIESNLRKILQHGQRADGIVKSMLQHSRGGNGIMEPTDLNAMVREFTNLAFHGMRAGKKPINVKIKYDLDDSITEIPLISDDFSRVILNLCNNAFDAMREVENPELTLSTKKTSAGVIFSVKDNGTGISDSIKDKILQPFFTTKRGKEGTGLGLAITNDIIKAHGGNLSITTKENEFTRFEIFVPSDQKLKA